MKISVTYHAKRNHPEIESNCARIICEFCEEFFARKTDLNSHIEAIHNGKTPLCDLCGKTFAQAKFLKRHIKYVHKEINFKCNQCDKKFPQNSKLVDHIQVFHLGQKYSCEYCEKTYTQKHHLNKHYKKEHGDFIHYFEDRRKNEIKEETEKKSIICDEKSRFCGICEHLFRTKQSLKNHNKRHHNGKIVKPMKTKPKMITLRFHSDE